MNKTPLKIEGSQTYLPVGGRILYLKRSNIIYGSYANSLNNCT